jgi:phospholipid/cholesterol/gamma-HCH transport system permease protein
LQYLVGALEFIGGITLLAWRVAKIILRGRLNWPLLMRQMVNLGVNSIPITMMVLGFGGAVFSYVLADEMYNRGAGSLVGGMLLMMLLREIIPLFAGTVLAGKIGASITSELGTMQISEQVDALRALSTDPDWYLTTPRVLAGVLMTPVIAIFAGYAGWYCGYFIAHQTTGMMYSSFETSVRMLVSWKDLIQCAVKCTVFGATIVLTACYFGYRARGGASGVGKVVTLSVVVNILLLYILDLLLTMALDVIKSWLAGGAGSLG